MTKLRLFFFTVIMAGAVQLAAAQDICPIIPQPSVAKKSGDQFTLNNNTPIVVSSESLRPVANYLQQELLKNQKIPLSVQASSVKPSIKLVLSAKIKPAYELDMNSKGVTITAKDPSGAFYGVVSLLQIARQTKNQKGTLILQGWIISDTPLYGWRGFMLDESRHFFGMEKVKSVLDWMAFYKLNRFHWHLTDEPAWRIEIKKYPGLALIGGVGDYFNEMLPAQYYTQEQVKEVVAYAAQRFITVIPEIDMPGHATAANRAYPEFSGGGGPGHPEFTFNPGKEGTYSYLSNILRETNALFPSGMIHLGGDEVSYGNHKWPTNPDIISLMQTQKLANSKEVEKYFMKRIADSVYNMNAKLLVWDEMAEVDLPVDKTIIFWWRHDKPDMLKLSLDKGFQTVLCPRLPFYFDFVQDSTHTNGRKWNKLYNPLKNVYEFTQDKYVKQTLKKDQILGVQADLWSETIQSEQRLDYLLFPRITALAEAAWTSQDNKDYARYMERLKGHLNLFQEQGLYYYNPFSPAKSPEPIKIGTGIKRFETGE
ncbi:beta-N-acetylhexosaminidase [Pedobacter frigoris]|nr:beta-N-acetylhexosaminidase [Pedobacter frigoris]